MKYEHFVQVSSNQKHIYNVIGSTVWPGEHFKATIVYFGGFAAVMVVLLQSWWLCCRHGGFAAVTHAFRRVRK